MKPRILKVADMRHHEVITIADLNHMTEFFQAQAYTQAGKLDKAE